MHHNIKIVVFIIILIISGNIAKADNYRVAFPDGKIVSLTYYYINNVEYISLIDASKKILPLSIFLEENHKILFKNCILHYLPGTFFIYAKINDTEKAIQMPLPIITKNGILLIHLKTFFHVLESLGIYKCEFYNNRAILRNMLIDKKPDPKKIAHFKQRKVNNKLTSDELSSTFIDTADYKNLSVINRQKPNLNNNSKPKKIMDKKKPEINLNTNVQMADKYMSSSTKRMEFFKNNSIIQDKSSVIDSKTLIDQSSQIDTLSSNTNNVSPVTSKIGPNKSDSVNLNSNSLSNPNKQLYPPSYYSIPKQLKRTEIDRKLEGQK